MQKNKANAQVAAVASSAILLAAIVYNIAVSPTITPVAVTIEQYQFQVYCPVDQLHSRLSLSQILANMGIKDKSTTADRLAVNTGNDIDEYIIYVQFRKASNTSQFGQFFYCSYVRSWEEEDCSHARPVCSSPGPLFYVQRGQKIDVAWVYDIHPADGVTLSSDFQFDNCYYPHPMHSDHSCKIENKAPGQRDCTYLDPSNPNYNTAQTSTISINLTMIPMTSHIHGLEVRPTFDGNPLSYVTSNGNVGLGYQSLGDDRYYRLFANFQPTEFDIKTDINLFAKINRYQNFQPAGSLWYHDHSMHATYVNVVSGMNGAYIIADPVAEKNLPSKKYDILILATSSYADTNPEVYDKESKDHSSSQHKMNRSEDQQKRTHAAHKNPSNAKFATRDSISFERNQTYRIRLLNGHFQAMFVDITFLTECNFANQTNPFDFSSCKKLNFTVIGADGSLFHAPIHNRTSLTMYSSERYDILIVFDGELNGQKINPISAGPQSIYMVTGQPTTAITNSNLRKEFKLRKATSPNLSPFPTQVKSIKTPYYDLRTITQPCKPGFEKSAVTSTTCIAATRFKPLLRDAAFNFVINGHNQFSNSGATDQPRIGTTEDWYMINTMIEPDIPHPIHIHLINFQAISQGELKKIPNPDPLSPNQCTYYEVDYYISAGAISENGSYSDLCNIIRSMVYLDPAFSQIMSSAFTEDKPTTGTTYGFDLLTKMTQDDFDSNAYSYAACPKSRFKYICNESLPIPEEDTRWKDVAKVDPNLFLRLRIRWAKTDYDPAVKPYPFFNVPEDQLIEFPGYIYHCHFLIHEDNEMMRPFTLQPSFFFDSYFSPKAGSTLETCMKKKGLNNSLGWPSRYACINEILGCHA